MTTTQATKTVKPVETRIGFNMDFTIETQYAKHPNGQWFRRSKDKTPVGYRQSAWEKCSEPTTATTDRFAARLPADVDAPKVARVYKPARWTVGAPIFVYVDGKPVMQARITDGGKTFIGTSFNTGMLMFLNDNKTVARNGNVEVRLMA